MVDFLGALILGVVQGITEWLPVSSSGHLVLFQQFFGLEASVAFDLMLHFSTLLAVLFVFRRETWSVFNAVVRGRFKTAEGRMGILIIIATVCSLPVALLLEQYVNFMFASTMVVGAGLLVTGFIVYSTRLERPKSVLDGRKAAFVGLAQGVAVVPGISRSGSTISAALATGIDRDKAIRFSFLLSIPAIAGATLYALKDAASFTAEPLPLVAGMLVSFIVGIISLRWLVGLIKRKRFWIFSIYCWIVGAAVLTLSFA